MLLGAAEGVYARAQVQRFRLTHSGCVILGCEETPEFLFSNPAPGNASYTYNSAPGPLWLPRAAFWGFCQLQLFRCPSNSTPRRSLGLEHVLEETLMSWR